MLNQLSEALIIIFGVLAAACGLMIYIENKNRPRGFVTENPYLTRGRMARAVHGRALIVQWIAAIAILALIGGWIWLITLTTTALR